MGTQAEPRQDFYWVDDREPHFQRRKDILQAHPEVTKLFGVNPRLKYVTVAMVIVQMTIAYYAHLMPWWVFLLVSFFVGATIAQALFLAIHEITHDLAFKTKLYNNWLALFANLPIVLPFAMSFKFHHAIHHWDQGKDGEDMDIPSKLEANVFRGFFGKVLWFFNQIVFYALRPTIGKPVKPDKWMIYNILFQVAAMAIFLPILFQNGWSGLIYLLLSLVFAGGLHPTAGHFISEHYVFKEGQETYSYYGPLNLVTFNVGYHNEHHDFPQVPGSRLPELKKIAPEFYDNLASYNSWSKVILDFLFRKDITLYSRTKRK